MIFSSTKIKAITNLQVSETADGVLICAEAEGGAVSIELDADKAKLLSNKLRYLTRNRNPEKKTATAKNSPTAGLNISVNCSRATDWATMSKLLKSITADDEPTLWTTT